MQRYAGAISEGINRVLADLDGPDFDAERAVEVLSVFDLELELELELELSAKAKEPPPSLSSVCAVLDNILSRGTPTLASPYVERALAERLGLTRKADSAIGNISFKQVDGLDEKILKQQVRRALYPVEPRLSPAVEYSFHSETGSLERRFATTFLPNQLGDGYQFIFQLLEPQRPFESIVDEGFVNQRCDFALELPSSGRYIFEVDGPDPHDCPEQRYQDQCRDEAAFDRKWKTIGVRNDEVTRGSFDDTLIPDRANRQRYNFSRIAALRKLEIKAPIQIAKASFAEPCWEGEFARKVSQLVLVPIAVARIQKTLIQLIRRGVLRFDEPKWKIAVHERDVPCAWLAIEDFLHLLDYYLVLKGSGFTPEVEVRTYVSEEFAHAELACPPACLSFTFCPEVAGFRGNQLDQVKPFDADVFLDIAVLHRPGLTKIESTLKSCVAWNATTALIRSVHSIQEEYHQQAAEPICYQVNGGKEGTALTYFLQRLFRKEEFREGQLDILKRAVAHQNVIGLLPTGAGKSICYQLAGMLQPGVTLVVDPLISLMKDQVQNLCTAGITHVVKINAELPPAEKKKIAQEMTEGKYQFVFISPERMQNLEFRVQLKKMLHGVGVKIVQVVIDEAHCVSEWGHDFRPAYLNLGRNAKGYCGKDIPLIGLTGTASFDVLSDVAREVGVNEQEALVASLSFNRKELHFYITPRRCDPRRNETNQKPQILREMLEDLPRRFGVSFEDFYSPRGPDTFSGIIFCPHKKGGFGVDAVKAHVDAMLEEEGIGPAVRCFHADLAPAVKETVQNEFKENRFPLLVATCAFGMGIDKPNIRYTIHYSAPQSIEAYYQEAGRAGRDRRDAFCISIFSDACAEDADWRLNTDTPLETIKKKKRPPFKKEGDAHRRLYFQFTSFPGTAKEKEVLYEVYNTIEPYLQQMQSIAFVPFKIGEFDDESKKTPGWIERAIYRLSLVGLVTDYTKDYNTKDYSISIVNPSDGELLDNMKWFVARYKSQTETDRVPERIRSRQLPNGRNSVLFQSIDFLIDFIYEEIEKKRRNALRELIEALRVGSENTLYFTERLDSYFNSKYLLELTRHSRAYSIDLLWQYIDEVGDNLDNVRHLHGATVRLLIEQDTHIVFRLLRSYAAFIHPHFNKEEALQFFQAFKEAVGNDELHEPNYSEVTGWMSCFCQAVIQRNPSAEPDLQTAIAEFHLSWLGPFNNDFWE